MFDTAVLPNLYMLEIDYRIMTLTYFISVRKLDSTPRNLKGITSVSVIQQPEGISICIKATCLQQV